jgi:hypothetical protein
MSYMSKGQFGVSCFFGLAYERRWIATTNRRNFAEKEWLTPTLSYLTGGGAGDSVKDCRKSE